MKLKNRFSMRLDDEQLGMVGEIIDKDPYKYDSISHILRVGLVKLHEEEMKRK